MTRARATYAEAMAAGQDAGNRSASRAGRDVWSEDDYSAAAKVVSKLLGDQPCA